MVSKSYNKISRLRDIGVFRTAYAVELGISQPTLSRLASAQVINRLEHGLFIHSQSKIDPSDLDFSLACAKFGKKSYVGGLSSLFRHNLIQQVPDQIWMIVPPQCKDSGRLYRCIRTKIDLEVGVEDCKYYLISTVDRAVVDGLYFEKKLGLDLAIGAARTAIKKGITSETRIYDLANRLGVINSIKKHWEAIVSE